MKRYLVFILFLPLTSVAQLQSAKIFSDNMVLQRDKPIHVWGKGSPGERVSISFDGENKFTAVSKDSSWSIYFKEQKANPRPQRILITCGKEKIELKNILIGDVWIASGQSNMEWPMIREMHWKEEVLKSGQPLIRLNNPPPAGRYIYGTAYGDSLNRRLTKDSFYLWNKWTACDSNTVKDMSAVAYFFAKAIVEKVKVPIGIINLSISGAPIETFISREAMQNSKQFSAKLKGNWLENDNLPKWIRERGQQNVGNNINGFKDEMGLNHGYKPGFAYEGGVQFLVPMPVKGVIWYQGESNSLEQDRVTEYKDLLHLLIDDYRTKWKQPDMPFYWVQLSSIDTTNYQSHYWPQFRDEQRRLLDEVKYGGMAVSSDIGFRRNVHPTNKKDVGERLAVWALNKTYKKEIVPSGPLPAKAEYENGEIIISFQYENGLATSDNKPLRGFSFDGESDVEARINNDKVIISARGKPEFIYYAWKPFTDANLVNGELLPASTFKLRVDGKVKASLLPLPQKLQWAEGFFPLNECRSIFINQSSILKDGQWLQQQLQEMGYSLSVVNKTPNQEKKPIVLQLGQVEAPINNEEAFGLTVDKDQVLLTANTPHGIFNGIQTLLQLVRDGSKIQACSITDWPAFAWRGYMIDVGRNYMSMTLLKQQIDVMAKYKLNVFHFHPTEDLAWRIAIKQYPQLTAPENMLRNKGQYYSEEEIKELIAYCRERHITFVPEIDMPGHSAAFRRAMKTDMQTDSGLLIVKNILKEICHTYDIPYIHIGADEVKITNQQFIPEVCAYLESLGKKVIGWEPGGNFSDHTIRQLWMDDNGKITGRNNIQYIDSRHLYLNHMDPLESVVTIFNRQIGNKEKGDASTLGGTICMWHDRAVASEADVLRMNPVYPAMLAFAERSWQGGGQKGWVANISDGDTAGFSEFENRLLEHKALFFRNKLFAYAKQSDLKWQLFGPFDNGGNVTKKFEPEYDSSALDKLKLVKEVFGGTIVLRHWWAPLIKGALDEPADSATWYAVTKIWSDEEGEKDFWIGFNNISRSPATDSPPPGAWDNKGSAIWVNGVLVSPPDWNRAGQKGHAEIALADEGYEYRDPAKIVLKKGFNTVLIKLPVASFKGKDWQNPVKWMFTFLSVEGQKKR